MSGRLAGKVAIVTGTSPNIGGTIASGFAADGARVACNDVRPEVAEGRAARIARRVAKRSRCPVDVTDPAR